MIFESQSFGRHETNLNAILNGGITSRSNQSQNTMLCSERSINLMQQQGNVNEMNIVNLLNVADKASSLPKVPLLVLLKMLNLVTVTTALSRKTTGLIS